MSEAYLNFIVEQEQPKLDHFFLLRRHEPYEKPYNDALGYRFLVYTSLFSTIPVVVLKVNTTQESYPMKKRLFLDDFPWLNIKNYGIPYFSLMPRSGPALTFKVYERF